MIPERSNTMKILHLTDASFDESVKGTSLPVLVDFYADWCGPCKMLAPTIEEIAANAVDFLVAKVNVDEAPAVAERFAVMSIPTLVVLRGGEEIARAVGLRPKDAILAMLP
jgi:thioredoxin 1